MASGGRKRVLGQTAEGRMWHSLRDFGSADIREAERRFPKASCKALYSILHRLILKGAVERTGTRTSAIYSAVGDAPPPDGRVANLKNLPRFDATGRFLTVVQRRREGTPGEVPQVPSLAMLLLG